MTRRAETRTAGRVCLLYEPMPEAITKSQLERLRRLIDAGEEAQFYSWGIWRNGIAPKVRKLDHYQCTRCGKPAHGRRGLIVHHVKPLRAAPELALSINDPATGARQLVSLCKRCHELQHPESLQRESAPAAKPLTPERWD